MDGLFVSLSLAVVGALLMFPARSILNNMKTRRHVRRKYGPDRADGKYW